MPVVPAEPVLLACAMCILFCTQGSRVRPASGVPRALFASRASLDAEPGQIVPRECGVTSPPLSLPGSTGQSSTPRLLRSSRADAGILDRPVKPGDDIELLFDS